MQSTHCTHTESNEILRGQNIFTYLNNNNITHIPHIPQINKYNNNGSTWIDKFMNSQVTW